LAEQSGGKLSPAVSTTGKAMLRFRRIRSLQKFAAVHASVFNHFNQERSLCSRQHFKASRAAALTEWRGIRAA
jgi:putative transposase